MRRPRRAAKPKAGPTEEDFQHASKIRFDRWLAGTGTIYFHVPNGGLRDPVTAHNMRLAGVRAGVGDWLIFTRDGRRFCLELKIRKGRQSDEQEKFQVAWERCGGIYEIARTLDEIDSFILRHGIA